MKLKLRIGLCHWFAAWVPDVRTLKLKSWAILLNGSVSSQLAENAAFYGPLQDKDRDKLSDGLNARLDEGALVPVRNYIEAITMQNASSDAIEESVFSKFTAILTPAAAGVAPKGFASTGTPIFNGLWTYLGFPSLSIPFTQIDGLPLGIQLVGARGRDVRLLQSAEWLSRHMAKVT